MRKIIIAQLAKLTKYAKFARLGITKSCRQGEVGVRNREPFVGIYFNCLPEDQKWTADISVAGN
jgi:hypothetical protein